MQIDTVLAPVDGSDESVDAARVAVAIADRYDARLHVLYVLGEAVARAIDGDRVEADNVADETRAFIGNVRKLSRDVSVEVGSSVAYGFSTNRKIQHPGSVVLDAAEEVAADFIVVPREPTAEGAETLEKVAEYVLLYASQPVCSV